MQAVLKRWRTFCGTTLFVACLSAVFGVVIVIAPPTGAGTACQALTGLSSVQLLVLGFWGYIAVLLVALSVPPSSPRSHPLCNASDAMGDLVGQYAAAVSGVVLGLIGFALLESGWTGVRASVYVFLICNLIVLMVAVWQHATPRLREVSGPRMDWGKAVFLMLSLHVLCRYVFMSQNWKAVSIGVDMCSAGA